MRTITSKILGKFSSAESDSVFGWMHALPKNDLLAAQTIISQQMPRILHECLLPDSTSLALICEFDARCRATVEALKQQYIHTAHLSSKIDKDIWDASYYYHRHLGIRYQRLLDDYEALNATDINGDEVKRLIARTMATKINMMQWHHFKNQDVPETSWRNLHTLFALAEKYRIENHSFIMFAGEPAVTIAEMYAQALMLGTLNNLNLSKHQTYFIARCLKIWLKDVQLTSDYQPGKYVFYVDFVLDQPAKRIRKFSFRPELRLFRTGQMSLILKNDLMLLNQGIYPGYLAEHYQAFSISQLKNLLEKVDSEWSTDTYVRQRRSESRQTVVKTALVAYGVNQVIQKVKALTDAKHIRLPQNMIDGRTLEERIATHTLYRGQDQLPSALILGENLLIVDQSPSGMGIMLSAETAIDIKVGNLILLLLQETQEAVIGVVRSIKTRANGKRHVGIALMSFTPLIVKLAPLASQLATSRPNSDPALMDWGFLGLYLDAEQSLDKLPSLILPRLEYNPHSIYEIDWRKQRSIMPLNKVIETETDWIRVACPSLVHKTIEA